MARSGSLASQSMRDGGVEHRFLAGRGSGIDDFRAQVLHHAKTRRIPVFLLGITVEHSLSGPAERSYILRLQRDLMRFVEIAAAQAFGMQTAQPEQFGIGAIGHFAEGLFRAAAVAGELSGLRLKQQGQRLMRQQLSGVSARLLRLARIAQSRGQHAA